jgi:cell division protein FtsW (lipid II flippase)
MVFKNSKYKTLIIIAAIGTAIAAWSVMSDIQKDRYLSLVDSDTASAATADGRLQGMVNEMVLGLTTRPILGNGLGTTVETKFHELGSGKASHNLYAELVIEVGLVGAFFFLSYIFCLRSSLLKAETHNRAAFWKNLILALLAVFWMYVIYSVNYYGLSQYYWYLFGGLVVSVSRILNREAVTSGE